MNSRPTIEAFRQSAAQWAGNSINYVFRRKYLNDYERQIALTNLVKYQQSLAESTFTVTVGPDVVEYWHQLEGLLYQQSKMNKDAILYGYPPYLLSGEKYKTRQFSIIIEATTNSMAPQILTGDNLLCVHMDREELLNYRGVAALAIQKNKATPRDWRIGRIEPIGGRLIRQTNDNKQFGKLDKVYPLGVIALSFKVVSLDRKFDHEHS